MIGRFNQLARQIGMPLGMLVLILAQLLCVNFFVLDVVGDYRQDSSFFDQNGHLLIETLATICFAIAIWVEWRFFRQLLRRQQVLEENITAARAAMQQVIDHHFAEWGLTRAERDIAGLMIKGCSIAEIAAFRHSAEATIKTHLNAIYRKSGTSGRSDLLARLLDEVMGQKP